MISPRRYGKTGLIYHVFDTLKENKSNFELYYADIYATHSADDFITMLAEAVTKELKKESLVKKFLSTLGSIRPVISPDPMSGVPQLSFTFQSDAERRYSIKALFDYLEHRPQKVIIAIDEFQQIREYDGFSMEALLRTYIQPLRNIQFIFSGSRKHLMAEMFTAENSPFYESAALYSIDKIDREVYARFIDEQFRREGKSICSGFGLNEAVVARQSPAHSIHLTAYGDNQKISDYSGDGIIIATPTGSTAYSMAAGGPIVEPTAENLVLTPMCAHSLTAKPYVLAGDRHTSVKLVRGDNDEAMLLVDGEDCVTLKTGDLVYVRKSSYVTRLIKLRSISFYEIVRHKLN